MRKQHDIWFQSRIHDTIIIRQFEASVRQDYDDYGVARWSLAGGLAITI